MNIEIDLIDDENLRKLMELDNKHVEEIIEKYVRICKPEKVTVLTDSDKDIDYIRKLALDNTEEKKLTEEGHTIHFDGILDQARDHPNTKIFISKGEKISKHINSVDRDKGYEEINMLMEGIMECKEMLVCFFCLGPTHSKFSIPSLQLTDSAYVVHSENILYRQGYNEFKNLNGSNNFFSFVHSAGKLDDWNNSKDIKNRRTYMDLEKKRVFSINNQYIANSSIKKLALRLAISKSHNENWLCEHMFIMGVHPNGKNRVTYFTGAFPSSCGKTSTAMIPGQTIIGDDIAYIRPGEDGQAYAVNVEQGIFGAIEDVNAEDDPIIYKILTTSREVIFSNILVSDNIPYWKGMGIELPENGINYTGEWFKGKKDDKGNDIAPSNENARYTIRIKELDNMDKRAEDPDGVPIGGFIYGGRDSDTTVPVLESLSWSHGVYIGAGIESETTAATIGKQGVRKHNPMANLEFLTVPIGVYINNHLKFGEALDKQPLIFSTNYFLKENGQFLNSKFDKKIWLLWMEGRVNKEFDCIDTPIGYVPRYEDLKNLFKEILYKDYSKDDYLKQFSIRVSKLLEKLDRLKQIYDEEDIPKTFHGHVSQEGERLLQAKEKFGKDIISPFEFE